MKVTETTTITLDDQVFEVSKLSAELQQMVAYLDDWRQREVDLTSELLMARSGIRDIQNALSGTLQKEMAELREKAQAMGLIAEANGEVAANEAN